MAAKTTTFWTFIVVLVLLHLVLRLAMGLTLIPDLLVVAALLGARRLGGWQAALYGQALGILADSVALVAFGATAVAFVIVCFLGSRSRNFFEGDSYLFVLVYALIGAWLVEAIRFFAGAALARGVELSWLIGPALLSAAWIALTTIAALIAYRAITGHR